MMRIGLTNNITKNISRFVSTKDLIYKDVNYDFMISKLRCKDLKKCPCVKFVNNLEVKDVEERLDLWLPILNKKGNHWCPTGPPESFEIISQEKEEEFLQKEIMRRDLEYYHLDTINNERIQIEEILSRAA